MKFVSALVTDREQVRDAAEVARLLAAQVRAKLEGEINLGIVFLSPHYAPKARLLAEELRRILNIGTLIGCSAEGVISTDQEIERAPAISLVAAHMPGVDITPFQLHVNEVQNWNELLDSTLAVPQSHWRAKCAEAVYVAGRSV